MFYVDEALKVCSCYIQIDKNLNFIITFYTRIKCKSFFLKKYEIYNPLQYLALADLMINITATRTWRQEILGNK